MPRDVRTGRGRALFLAAPLLVSAAGAVGEAPDGARVGLDLGFARAAASAELARRPAAPRTPRRFVYIVASVELHERTVTQFMAWLDGKACAIPAAGGNEPIVPAGYTVRGRLELGEGQVRIDAQANNAAGASIGRASVEVRGADASAVAGAVSQTLAKLGLVCRR